MNVITCLVLALLAAVSAAPQDRLFGGTPTSVEEFPYVASLTYYYAGPGITVQRCVGALISSWHVLTTAYCFRGANNDNMIVRAGSTNALSGGSVAGVTQVIQHPDYVGAPRTNDLAVVFLTAPFGLSSVIDVLYLPPGGTYIPNGYDVKVVSWGFEYVGGPQNDLLKTITLNKVSTEDCAAKFADNDSVKISDDVICATATGRGLCMGDSGAPLVIGRVLMGVSSYFDHCGSGDYPDVFTRVDSHTNWILEVATAPSSDAVGIRSSPVRL